MLPSSWITARHGLYSMPKIKSPTLPASCRMMLAAPPDLRSWIRCSGSRIAWLITSFRTDIWINFVMRLNAALPRLPMLQMGRWKFKSVRLILLIKRLGKRCVQADAHPKRGIFGSIFVGQRIGISIASFLSNACQHCFFSEVFVAE